MKEIFGVSLGVFENLEIDNDAILDSLEELDFIDNNPQGQNPNRQTNHYLHKDPKFDCITNFVKDSLELYRANQGWDCNQLEITIMWGNKDLPQSGTHHMLHQHQSSLVSGVYYATGGSDIYWRDPIYQRLYNAFGVRSVYGRYDVRHTPKPGQLVMFPSWLEHGTLPHTNWKKRWSIAFNAVPTGAINANVNASGNPSIVLKLDD